MKIAYVFHNDAANPAIQSGRPAALLHEFTRQGHDVARIFPLPVPTTGAEFAKKVGYRLLRKHHRHDRHEDYLNALAQQYHARAAGRAFDLVFSPGSEVVSHLPADLPIVYCADATFANLGVHVPVAGGLASGGFAYARDVGAEAVQVFLSNPRGWARSAGDSKQDDEFRSRCAEAKMPTFADSPAARKISMGPPSDSLSGALNATRFHNALRVSRRTAPPSWTARPEASSGP